MTNRTQPRAGSGLRSKLVLSALRVASGELSGGKAQQVKLTTELQRAQHG
ncbi:hypothetical protein [Mucilaginibacter jinjuensis]|uniref:Uncharacterized protein n=1 Tax=Mucilaginibacter jinjuensis TaxID=1176721 RepID=A0ABY7TCT8_9SPHI|nr:hypothetical protein [Mucilaginibacter jinjuensis]WCT13437.1 hypothetical protein PQO05_05755 [Mucilaginibacter jinjuensis]